MNPKNPQISQPVLFEMDPPTELVQHDAGGKARPAWPKDSTVTAVFSDCQRYRYQLREVWDPGRPMVLWLLMNPSVACLDHADPTLRKTGNFARIWGYGGQWVGNVHAYRSTNKNRLLEVEDPVGPDNDRLILERAEQAQTVVLAYGQPPKQLRARCPSSRSPAPPPAVVSFAIGPRWNPRSPALPALQPSPPTPCRHGVRHPGLSH